MDGRMDGRFASGVYVMAAPAHPDWGVKIGMTLGSTVHARARDVAGELPVDVVVLAFVPMPGGWGTRRCERWLHQRLAAYRWRGEWFHFVPDFSWSGWLQAEVRQWTLEVAAEAIDNATPEELAEELSVDDLGELHGKVTKAIAFAESH